MHLVADAVVRLAKSIKTSAVSRRRLLCTISTTLSYIVVCEIGSKWPRVNMYDASDPEIRFLAVQACNPTSWVATGDARDTVQEWRVYGLQCFLFPPMYGYL